MKDNRLAHSAMSGYLKDMLCLILDISLRDSVCPLVMLLYKRFLTKIFTKISPFMSLDINQSLNTSYNNKIQVFKFKRPQKFIFQGDFFFNFSLRFENQRFMKINVT